MLRNIGRIAVVFTSAVLALSASSVVQHTPGARPAPGRLSAADWSGIQAAYEAGRYAAQRAGEGYRVHNPGQRWQTCFDGRGFTTRPDAGGWTWGLDLLRYGFAGSERQVGSPARTEAEGGRVAYDWDATIQEWYVNDTRGLEHGYTLLHRPMADDENTASEQRTPLTLTLAVRGELSPVVQADGCGVRFMDDDGAAVLTYSGLTVFDADRRVLPARFEQVADGLLLSIDEEGARYPLTIDPVAQQAYLKASNTNGFTLSELGDYFGRSVAVSGDTVVVGAYREDSSATGVNGDDSDNSAKESGAVYVFVRSGTSWSQQAYLKASNTERFDLFGWSVAVSGDTVVVGAYNEESAATGVDGDQGDNSAGSSGAAYVFVRNGTSWSQQAYLKASNTDAGDRFGWSVAASGDTVVVGARNEASSATGVNGDQSDNAADVSGAAYVFVQSGTSWSQQAYLKASNTERLDRFGWSVAASDDTVVVGAYNEESAATGVDGDQGDNSAAAAGAAYVFVRAGTSWSQQAYFKASNTDAGDLFGWSVAASGDTMVVGAWGEASAATGVNGDQSDNSAFGSGAAYVFERNGTSWSQQAYLKASNTDAGDSFGRSVSVSGSTVVAGASSEASSSTGVDGDQSDDSAAAAGAAYLFVRTGTAWNQEAYVKASNTDAGDEFGRAVAVAGDTLVVGAFLEDSGATGVNGDQSNFWDDSGAAYAFDVPPPECFLVVGDGPGNASFTEISHVFETQVGPTVEGVFPVLLDDIPEFVLPGPGNWAVPVSAAAGPGGTGTWQTEVPSWMLDGRFTVQVLMWNPWIFPQLPEQCSSGLAVRIEPNGSVSARPYGTAVGEMDIWHEIDTNAAGQAIIRFPFSIAGM